MRAARAASACFAWLPSEPAGSDSAVDIGGDSAGGVTAPEEGERPQGDPVGAEASEWMNVACLVGKAEGTGTPARTLA